MAQRKVKTLCPGSNSSPSDYETDALPTALPKLYVCYYATTTYLNMLVHCSPVELILLATMDLMPSSTQPDGVTWLQRSALLLPIVVSITVRPAEVRVKSSIENRTPGYLKHETDWGNVFVI